MRATPTAIDIATPKFGGAAVPFVALDMRALLRRTRTMRSVSGPCRSADPSPVVFADLGDDAAVGALARKRLAQ
jgi:hypothetical protein